MALYGVLCDVLSFFLPSSFNTFLLKFKAWSQLCSVESVELSPFLGRCSREERPLLEPRAVVAVRSSIEATCFKQHRDHTAVKKCGCDDNVEFDHSTEIL